MSGEQAGSGAGHPATAEESSEEEPSEPGVRAGVRHPPLPGPLDPPFMRRGEVVRRKEALVRKLKLTGRELDEARAAWDEADNTPERRAMRAARAASQHRAKQRATTRAERFLASETDQANNKGERARRLRGRCPCRLVRGPLPHARRRIARRAKAT